MTSTSQLSKVKFLISEFPVGYLNFMIQQWSSKTMRRIYYIYYYNCMENNNRKDNANISIKFYTVVKKCEYNAERIKYSH